MRLLAEIANLEFPGEARRSRTRDGQLLHPLLHPKMKTEQEVDQIPHRPINSREMEVFLTRAKMKTERFWPELWNQEVDQIPPELALRQMRSYLRGFWRSSDERDRDWLIHRAREFCQTHRVLRETRELSLRWRAAQTIDELNSLAFDIQVKTKEILDAVPPHSEIEDALFELQKKARIPSKRPLYCPDCTQGKPYFLSARKGQKYCSPECAETAIRASKRESWESNKQRWRKK